MSVADAIARRSDQLMGAKLQQLVVEEQRKARKEALRTQLFQQMKADRERKKAEQEARRDANLQLGLTIGGAALGGIGGALVAPASIGAGAGALYGAGIGGGLGGTIGGLATQNPQAVSAGLQGIGSVGGQALQQNNYQQLIGMLRANQPAQSFGGGLGGAPDPRFELNPVVGNGLDPMLLQILGGL